MNAAIAIEVSKKFLQYKNLMLVSFFFRILTSVRGLQVLCRYSDQCQGFAGTLQVP